VLRDGKVVRTADTADVTMSGLVELIVGEAVRRAAAPEPHPQIEQTRLDVHDLVTEQAGPVSFRMGIGEVVGLVGLRGSGQESIGRALVGATHVAGGQVRVDGAEVQTSDPRAARRARIGFATSRREEESLATTLTVGENALLNPALTGRRVRDVSSRRRERATAQRVLDHFGVRPAEPDRPILTLSGGNQQKVVIGREMHAEPRVLVLEEATMGVDVRSKAEIYGLLAHAAAAGCAVLVVSTDADDVVTLCHRALVMHRGRIVSEIMRENLMGPALISAIEGSAATGATSGRTSERTA
jgi:ribose transport system ATP-binding protein